MVCKRLSKSSPNTTLFPLNLFEDGNVNGFFAFSKIFAIIPIHISFPTE
ncbi:hypothetical protein T4D_2353 [Trichinella pseudospiralis]|uniref:Uncharacterized protein n=1 Tax=Trichinella pseudospiralis TaxID=6337 RepID=A0A0V1DN46_TRIPS|nr:hypothetical protein T4D_2353 [Trichinella pseudospiralis]